MATDSPGRGRSRSTSDASASSHPAPGVVLFGRYRLDERLGEGGLAAVWRAHDEEAAEDVALKLVHRHLLPDDRARERFAAEARGASTIAHPGIVGVRDVVVEGSLVAIVMDLVESAPLGDVIASHGRLPEVAAAAIAAQVAQALQAAHDRGLIHRDVRPANVLLAPDGTARLVDFGIGRVVEDGEAGPTQPGTIMGSLRYLAPEQLADGAADRATDVFGVGSILYEMLVGRPPFPAATPAALMAQQRQGAPQVFNVSPELAGLARAALQHDPERRPRSAGRMAALLEGWLQHHGISPSDLSAVAAAALAGRPAPRATPAAVPPGFAPSAASAATVYGAWTTPPADVPPAAVPAATAQPAVPPAPAEAKAPGRRRRGRAPAAPEIAALPLFPDPGAAPAGAAVPAGAPPPGGWPTDHASAPPVLLPSDVPQVSSRRPDGAPSTLVRPVARAVALGGRRVPLVAALGLAGLLLAGLLLGGAWAGLQAGSGRPSPSSAPVSGPAASAPAASAPTASGVGAGPSASASASVAPSLRPSALPSAKPAGSAKPAATPQPSPRRGH